MVDTLPVRVEQVFYAGTDAVREYRWLTGGAPQDLTGWAAELRVGAAYGYAVLVITTNDEGDGLTLLPDGKITVHVTNDQTAALVGTEYLYILDLIDPGGFRSRFMRGPVTVVHELELVEAATP